MPTFCFSPWKSVGGVGANVGALLVAREEVELRLLTGRQAQLITAMFAAPRRPASRTWTCSDDSILVGCSGVLPPDRLKKERARWWVQRLLRVWARVGAMGCRGVCDLVARGTSLQTSAGARASLICRTR